MARLEKSCQLSDLMIQLMINDDKWPDLATLAPA